MSALATSLTKEQIERLREWSAREGMGWHLACNSKAQTPLDRVWRDADGKWMMKVRRWHPEKDANQAMKLAERQNLWWDYALGHSGDIGYFAFNWSTVGERPCGHPDTTLAVAETVPMAVLLAVAIKCGYDYRATTEVRQ